MMWVKAWNAAERTSDPKNAMPADRGGQKVLLAAFCRKTRADDTKPKYLLTKSSKGVDYETSKSETQSQARR
jgi:hypothetical protein